MRVPKVYSLDNFKHLTRITLKQAKEKKLSVFGSAIGTDIGHCIYEGTLHCKDFPKRAKYYVVVNAIKDISKNARKKINKGQLVKINFYGDNN